MVDPTPDPIDRAYSQAESLLDEQAERSARRARVLAAVEQEAVIPPTSRPKSMPRDTSRGRWLVAASLLIAAGFLALRFLPLNQQGSSPPVAHAPVAQLVQKNQMTAALSPPTPKTNQSGPMPLAPKSKESDQATTVTPKRKETSNTRMALASPPPSPAILAQPPAAAPAPATAAAAPLPAAAPPPAIVSAPPPAIAAAPRAAPAFAMAPPPPPSAAAPSPPSPAPTRPPMADASKPIGELGSNLGAEQLRAAAAAGRTTEVQDLLNRQISVDAADADGETALMKSIRADQPVTAALLIRHGARLDKKNNAGLSARDLATQINDPALNRVLGVEH
jgi:hypothetical protein